MTLMIEVEAYKAILFGTLSCKCPVTQETESKFFEEYFRNSSSQTIDFAPIKAIADQNPVKTPIHNLLEISSYGHDDPTDFTITLGDVLRALGSQFHFNNMTGNLSHTTVRDIPSFLVSHLLVPMRLALFGDNIQAIYTFNRQKKTFENIFVPTDIEWDEDKFYAVHMGTVICPLSPVQADNLQAHLNLISGFDHLCTQFESVDFRNFQYYGNYYRQVKTRFQRYFQ